MGRAKTPAWQRTAFHTKMDETKGRWVARTRYRDGAGQLVMIKRQGRTKGAAEQAVRVTIRQAEKKWGEANKSTTLTVAMLAAEWLEVRRPAAMKIDPETQSGARRRKGSFAGGDIGRNCRTMHSQPLVRSRWLN